MEAELVVPGGPQQLAADATFALILAEQGSDYPAQHPQVLRRGAVLEPAGVLPEDDIQHPVQPVLDPPVPAGGPAQLAGTAPAAADVMGHLEALLAPLPSGPENADNGLHVGPLLPGAQPPQVVQ